MPSVAVVVRRVFGVGGAGLWDGQGLNLRYAWPSADWGSLPLEGGIEAAYRADLDAAADRDALLAEITQRLDAVRSPFRTAEHFGIEAVIDPHDTRPTLCRWARDAYAVVPHLLGPSARQMRP